MRKLVRIWHTVKYLKLIQFYYQLRIRLIPNTQPQQFSSNRTIECFPLVLTNTGITLTPSLRGFNNFSFLNISHSFKNSIDWNYCENGKLWTYNLTYFDFLNQKDLNRENGLELVLDYIKEFENIKDGNEPYPISLRCINWIKFISNNDINNEDIVMSLFSQYNYLTHKLEYHLLGNHLLENGFSLLLGSYYFQNNKFYTKAKSILKKQLNEQILTDGGHFELSPMYHKILLFRLLDTINTIKHNHWQKDDLLAFLTHKAQLMLAWLKAITYSNGATANVNDSTNDIAPSTTDLLNYAKKLNLNWGIQKLQDSGYRLFKKSNFELLIDIGKIGPDYIPGHAHADTFNFELMVNENPIIVDTGISTYEKNSKRQVERSTVSHNTVVVNNINQSDVWGGFRVGKRAKITSLKETENFVNASHNGYKDLGVIHTRSFQINDNEVIINDTIEQKTRQKHEVCSLLHFHPNVSISKQGSKIIITNFNLEIIFTSDTKIEIQEFEFCKGFNKTTTSLMALVYFQKSLTTKILVK